MNNFFFLRILSILLFSSPRIDCYVENVEFALNDL